MWGWTHSSGGRDGFYPALISACAPAGHHGVGQLAIMGVLTSHYFINVYYLSADSRLRLVVNTNVVPAPNILRYRRQIHHKETGRDRGLWHCLVCRLLDCFFLVGRDGWGGNFVLVSCTFFPSQGIGAGSAFDTARRCCVCAHRRCLYGFAWGEWCLGQHNSCRGGNKVKGCDTFLTASLKMKEEALSWWRLLQWVCGACKEGTDVEYSYSRNGRIGGRMNLETLVHEMAWIVREARW